MYEPGTPAPAPQLHQESRVRAVVIVNPAAGRRAIRRIRPDDVLPVLRSSGFALERVETRADGPDAGEIAARAVREGYDAVIVAGGDGTVASAGRALVGTATALGILPFGSAMNIAHGLGLPLDAHEAAAVIARRRTRGVDVGLANGRMFFETAGIGLDAELFGAARDAERRSWPYALRRIRRWATAETRTLRVVVDGAAHDHRAMQLLVLNSPYYLWAIRLLPDASMTDGLLDVAVFPRMGRRDLVGALLDGWRTGRLGGRFIHYRGREIRIESSPSIGVHADGEIAGESPIDIGLRPEALRVFV